MAQFRNKADKKKVVEARRVRLDTRAEKLIGSDGSLAPARLGDWVIHEPPFKMTVMEHGDFCTDYVSIDSGGMIDMGSDVTGIENYEIQKESKKRGKGKSRKGQTGGTGGS